MHQTWQGVHQHLQLQGVEQRATQRRDASALIPQAAIIVAAVLNKLPCHLLSWISGHKCQGRHGGSAPAQHRPPARRGGRWQRPCS